MYFSGCVFFCEVRLLANPDSFVIYLQQGVMWNERTSISMKLIDNYSDIFLGLDSGALAIQVSNATIAATSSHRTGKLDNCYYHSPVKVA